MSEIELVKRLRERAETEAKTSCLLANAKTERNRAAGDSYANYRGLSVDETLPWQAADAIEALTAALEDMIGASEHDGTYQECLECEAINKGRAALRKVRP